jgi:hypothetical protein
MLKLKSLLFLEKIKKKTLLENSVRLLKNSKKQTFFIIFT